MLCSRPPAPTLEQNNEVKYSKGDLLSDAEVGEDVVEDGAAGNLAAGDFSDGRDRSTQIGRQEVRRETFH